MRVEARHVCKTYGSRSVVNNVDLQVPAGRSIALLGHNGAGKTTLMKLLLGLALPSAGEVRLLGQDPGHSAGALRRAVGYMPESVAFQGGMTGRQLMRFYAGLKDAPRDQAEELLARVGLEDAAGRATRTYSKGMRQRLGLAQALLGSPKVLFLDEPTNGLDPPLRHAFYDTVAALVGDGASALIASHMLAEIEHRVDEIAILRDGDLVACGSMDDLRAASRLPFRLRLRVQPDAVGAVSEAVGGAFSLTDVHDGVMDFTCDSADKMTIVRRVAGLDGVVRDVDILPPRLDEIYAHYVGGEHRA